MRKNEIALALHLLILIAIVFIAQDVAYVWQNIAVLLFVVLNVTLQLVAAVDFATKKSKNHRIVRAIKGLLLRISNVAFVILLLQPTESAAVLLFYVLALLFVPTKLQMYGFFTAFVAFTTYRFVEAGGTWAALHDALPTLLAGPNSAAYAYSVVVVGYLLALAFQELKLGSIGASLTSGLIGLITLPLVLPAVLLFAVGKAVYKAGYTVVNGYMTSYFEISNSWRFVRSAEQVTPLTPLRSISRIIRLDCKIMLKYYFRTKISYPYYLFHELYIRLVQIVTYALSFVFGHMLLVVAFAVHSILYAVLLPIMSMRLRRKQPSSEKQTGSVREEEQAPIVAAAQPAVAGGEKAEEMDSPLFTESRELFSAEPATSFSAARESIREGADNKISLEKREAPQTEHEPLVKEKMEAEPIARERSETYEKL